MRLSKKMKVRLLTVVFIGFVGLISLVAAEPVRRPNPLSRKTATSKGTMPQFNMPGRSYSGALPPPSAEEKKLAVQLKKDVEHLSVRIGERNTRHYDALTRAAKYLQDRLPKEGWTISRQPYKSDGWTVWNIIAERKGAVAPGEIIVIGGHYDSAWRSPGANDNATACAALLAMAHRYKASKFDRTLRLVFFVNEEPPFFQTREMGSLVYARACRKKNENIVAMMSLDMLGAFSDKKGSQKYPPPFQLFYPSKGNFIGFFSDVKSGPLLKYTVGNFRRDTKFPSQGAAAPETLPGIGWSDHWSFWQCDYRAIMVTDMAPFRTKTYHTPGDTIKTVDFDRMTRVTSGLFLIVEDWTKKPPKPPPKKVQGKLKKIL